jgi:hypothetical protein
MHGIRASGAQVARWGPGGRRSAEPHRRADERGVARRQLASGLVERVLQADPGVETPADRVGEQHPGGVPVAVLEPWRGETEPVQRAVDVLDEWDRPGGAGVDGLDQDPGDPATRSGRCESFGVLDAPDARLDADARVEQGLHDLRRARFGEVDRRVVGFTPGPDELEPASEVGLDPGAGRHADGHAARRADPGDDLVDDLGLQPLAAGGIAGVQVDGTSPGGHARRGIPRELLGRHRYRRVRRLRQVAVQRRLEQHRADAAPKGATG